MPLFIEFDRKIKKLNKKLIYSISSSVSSNEKSTDDISVVSSDTASVIFTTNSFQSMCSALISMLTFIIITPLFLSLFCHTIMNEPILTFLFYFQSSSSLQVARVAHSQTYRKIKMHLILLYYNYIYRPPFTSITCPVI